MPRFSSSLASAQTWVEPTSLPDYLDASQVAGNVSLEHKRLCLNTLGAYGLGGQDSFAYSAGAQIRITELNYKTEGERVEVVAVSEVNNPITHSPRSSRRRSSSLHAVLRSCGSAPLVVLGLMRGVNGVGVSQALSIFFHAPASMRVIPLCLPIPPLLTDVKQRHLYAHHEYQYSSWDADTFFQMRSSYLSSLPSSYRKTSR
ncbi:hypothetical protein BN946_scf184876.g6 [Trametes cinnabarina]|uniref:Uncharacterized protein n=1 Tax=Pycnoporus cinnabarinus TaxID=5643 RepID=A0A060SUG4_PYCCI|nr:hypothetical protein BN946_scf184876.g6 [Trametes cinnabarina]